MRAVIMGNRKENTAHLKGNGDGRKSTEIEIEIEGMSLEATNHAVTSLATGKSDGRDGDNETLKPRMKMRYRTKRERNIVRKIEE